jgi:hypothetical protein
MKTITKVYDSYGQAREAVAALEASGIPAADISLIANKYVSSQYADVQEASDMTKGAGIGGALGAGTGLLAGLGLLAIPGLGPVVAAGWLAATAVGAVAGAAAGGLIGALVDAGEDREHAHVYAEAVRRGGTLLSVRVPENLEQRVRDLLAGYRPIDPALRATEYRRAGWSGTFDPAAPAYRPSDAEVERIRSEWRA